MADLPSAFVKINDVEVAADAPVTEALFSEIGSDANYLKDNLDAEITNRGNADTAITNDINTNVKGAGPIQTLTDLKERVDLLTQVLRLNYSGTDTAVTGTYTQSQIHLSAQDGDTYQIVAITGIAGSYVVTSLLDTHVAVSNFIFAEFSMTASSANIFARLRLYETRFE